jgi:hypothetical protein
MILFWAFLLILMGIGSIIAELVMWLSNFWKRGQRLPNR